MTYLVKDYLGMKGKEGNIALELEVEAKKGLPLLNNAMWVTHNEQSIRNGVEYVNKKPLTPLKMTEAIGWLTKELDVKTYDILLDSPRTSVHTHINYLYHTPLQYWTSITAYWIAENLLFDFCGDYRKGNGFCLRLSDAEGVINYCLKSLRQEIPFTGIPMDSIRYAGQNLEATLKFGSIEYRGMSFTLDPRKLNTWSQELYNLSLNVKDFATPARLMDEYFMAEDPRDFLGKLFSKDFVREITVSNDWKQKLEANEGTICELAYFQDWDAWGKKIEENYKKPEEKKKMPGWALGWADDILEIQPQAVNHLVDVRVEQNRLGLPNLEDF